MSAAPTKPDEVNPGCSKNKFVAFFAKEDALDRVPGMRAWKAVATVLVLIAIGLGVVGFATNSIGHPQNYPLDGLCIAHDKQKQIKYGTVWNWIHFMLYYLLALLFPDSWLLLWLVGVAWETLETCCLWADWNDIAFNTAGIAAGVLTRKLLIPLAGKFTPTAAAKC